MSTTFHAFDLWDVIIAYLTPVVPTYREFAAQTTFPFAVLVQHGSSYTHFSRSDSQQTCVVSEGSFEVNIYGETLHDTGRVADFVRAKLDLFSSPITYTDGRLMAMQPASSVMLPELMTGPGSPTVFHARVLVDYAEQRTLAIY